MPDIRASPTARFSETLIKGDPHEGRVIKETARQALRSILPRRRQG